MFCNRQPILKTASIIAMMAVLSANVTANASALNPGLKTTLGKIESTSTSFSDLTNGKTDLLLDWRTPSHVIEFDLTDSNWTTALSLVLSVDPLSRVDPSAPIYVRLNTGKAVKLNTKGKGFDARVRLDPSDLKETRNKLIVYLGSPADSECFLPQHGEWSINLAASSLDVRTRAKSRNYTIKDLTERFSNPILKPKKIGLIAKGDNAAKHQALLAQSLGIRLETIPDFTTTDYTDDIDFIVGRRDIINDQVRNKKLLQKNGSKIFVDSGRPLRVFLTGDTDKEVDRSVRAFAQYEFPSSEAALLDAGFLSLQPRLQSRETMVSSARTRLSDMGDLDFNQSWSPGSSDITFDVEDPLTAHGEFLLRLNTPSSLIKTESNLTLKLNGQPLGQTTLDKKRKSVSFQIPKGILQGQDNELSLEPQLRTENIQSCSQINYEDNALYLGAGSSLKLTKNNKTPIGDVSHLMATGAPFSDLGGKDTVLVLPQDARDYHVSLAMLAQFAKASGQSWSRANFIRDVSSLSGSEKNKNILFLTPSNQLPMSIQRKAPKTVKLALNGQASEGANLSSQVIRQYARNDLIDTLEDSTRRSSSMHSVNRGGVAALFESPFNRDKVVGVLTNTPKQSFKRSMSFLENSDHWNALEGSVSRWNKNSVLMTDLSLDLPNFIRPEPELDFADKLKYRFSEMKVTASDFVQFDWPNINVPDVNFSEINWPKFDFEWPEMPKLNFGSIREKFSNSENLDTVDVIDTPKYELKTETKQNGRTPLLVVDNNKLSKEVPLLRKTTGPSFLDSALSQSSKKQTADLNLKGLSRVTGQGIVIDSDNDSNSFKNAVSVRWNAVKTSLTKWYKDLSLLVKSKAEPYEYKGTDQTFSLLMLLTVLSIGGLFISVAFSSRKRRPRRH